MHSIPPSNSGHSTPASLSCRLCTSTTRTLDTRMVLYENCTSRGSLHQSRLIAPVEALCTSRGSLHQSRLTVHVGVHRLIITHHRTAPQLHRQYNNMPAACEGTYVRHSRGDLSRPPRKTNLSVPTFPQCSLGRGATATFGM